MNGQIECAITGRLAQEVQLRTSKSGKPWASLSIAVGADDDVQWVRCACFGETAEQAAKIVKGATVYIEGKIRLDRWEKDGEAKAGLSVTASIVMALGQIGRRRVSDDNAQRRPARSAAKADCARPAEADARPAGRDPVRQDAIPF